MRPDSSHITLEMLVRSFGSVNEDETDHEDHEDNESVPPTDQQPDDTNANAIDNWNH